jgi:predicted nucleic acid-binding protein
VAELRARTIANEYTIADVSAQIAEEGARISHRLRIPMADSLIMATAKSLRVPCVTDDPHFTEVKRVWIS